MKSLIAFLYQNLLKPILFLFDPEHIHDFFVTTGRFLGRFQVTRSLTLVLFGFNHPSLKQTVAGLNFQNPVGLSAGFDYDAKISGITASVGYGFESVGTVTNRPYEGNTSPRLARLPNTKSLLVNKGFKSAGIHKVLNDYLEKPNPDFILGLSIGATNSPQTAEPKTQIPDIINAFKATKAHPKYKLIDYLELNISCPNVVGAGTLATPKHLTDALKKLQALKLGKPLFVKFPIHIEDDDAIELVNIMVKYKVAAVIIGNLYKKRDPESFDSQDLSKVKDLKGNFSGKPTENLSNHLISLIYKEFKDKITIIGVGGIFTPEDAYEKIKRGATLIQLITGMVFQGPQLIGQINQGLVGLLKQDGYNSLTEAIGAHHNK